MSQPTKRTVKSSTAIVAILVVVAFGSVSGGSVFDDAKFKLNLRGDPNANAYIDAGEVGNAFDFSAASPDSVIYGGGNGKSNISAEQYDSQGTATYGTLPYVSDVSVTSPYDGSVVSRPCLVMPQETKTENSSTYWAENGVVMPNSGVQPGSSGYVTIYSRFKWDGSTSNPNLLVGNGWNGTYEDFVAWDAINRTSASHAPRKAQPNYVEKNFQPLAPPVVIHHSWRDQ